MPNKNLTNLFLKDVKRLKKRKLDIEKLENIIDLLCENKELPKYCRPHILPPISLERTSTPRSDCHPWPDTTAVKN
jgi:mRNA-degrading endonuclease YafQ of YafQ-DinJ toxin-antitoxin module